MNFLFCEDATTGQNYIFSGTDDFFYGAILNIFLLFLQTARQVLDSRVFNS